MDHETLPPCPRADCNANPSWREHFHELLMEARSQGWIAAVASMRYPDGTPVEIVANVNPFRTTTDPEETDHA